MDYVEMLFVKMSSKAVIPTPTLSGTRFLQSIRLFNAPLQPSTDTKTN